MEQRIAALEKDMEKNSQQHGEFYKRFGQLESFQARTDEKYNNIMREIEKMSETLEELKSAPAKNWNTVVSSAISGIVGAVVGFLMRGGLWDGWFWTEGSRETWEFGDRIAGRTVQWALIVILITLLAATNIYHIYEWSQFDTIVVDSKDGGNASYIGNDGDVNNYGAGYSTETEEKQPTEIQGNAD